VLEIGEDNVKLLIGRKSPAGTVEEQAKALADNLKRFEGIGIAECQSNPGALFPLRRFGKQRNCLLSQQRGR
jgi:hypothetical protein